jgi:putative inorganic carbon (HCO3(-)) transporter
MRDLLVALIILGSLPIILSRPYVGVLVWAWIGYMNPHRLGWGFAYDFPFAYIVAIVTLVAVFFSKEPKRFPVTGLTVTWLLFIAWMGLTTVFAFYPAAAWEPYVNILKIQLMTFATILLMCSRERLHMLLWVIVLSLGFFGVKGGIFTILNGGVYHVWGPPGSFIEGNNELALALLMILPLMQYLRSNSPNKWVRHGLLAAMVLCAFSIVGSQSRGALVGGLAMAFFLWLKSKHKVVTGAVLVMFIPLLFVFMPQSWHDRMWTIETYDQDASAMNRIETWKMALRLANDKIVGGGFELWTPEIYDRYAPGAASMDAHSIYFKVLGEHGWIGLAIFVGIGLIAWRTASWTIRSAKDRKDLEWLAEMGRSIQVSLVAFAAGGTFLGLSYFDLYWHLVAIVVVGKVLTQQYLAASGSEIVSRRDAPFRSWTVSRDS